MSKLLHSSVKLAQDSIQLIGNQVQLLNGEDLNNYTSGISCIINCTNAPDTDWYMMIASRADEGTAIQVCFGINKKNVYRRAMASDKWYDWVQLI